MSDTRDKCGVFGISGPSVSFSSIRNGIRIEQHRGQDGCGVAAVAADGSTLYRRRLGLVDDVLDSSLFGLHFISGIAHARYSTQGENVDDNLQPHCAASQMGKIYVASNGHVVNYGKLRQLLEENGVTFRSQNDAELLAKNIAWKVNSTGDIIDALRYLRGAIDGAYSAVALVGNRLFAIRDSFGFRPLVMSNVPERRGDHPSSGAIAVASETVSFDRIGCERLQSRVLKAGCIVEITGGEVVVHDEGWPAKWRCSFEVDYFQRPDGYAYGMTTAAFFRERIGRAAGEALVRSGILDELDRSRIVVGGVPDSGEAIAVGVAQILGMPISKVLIRDHYVHRVFITHSQEFRDERTADKLNPNPDVVEGKIIIIVDDSIVRGTTVGEFVKMLKGAGALKVIVVVGFPPVRFSCHMGIATPTHAELVANRMNADELARASGADAIIYNDLEPFKRCLGPLTEHERNQYDQVLAPFLDARDAPCRQRGLDALERSDPNSFCYACLTGKYPFDVPNS